MRAGDAAPRSDARLSGKKVLTLAAALLDDPDESREAMSEDREYFVTAPTTTLVVTPTARVAAWEQTLRECLDDATFERRVRILRTARDLRRLPLTAFAPGGGVRIVITTDRRLQSRSGLAEPRHRDFIARMNCLVHEDDDPPLSAASAGPGAGPGADMLSPLVQLDTNLDDVGMWNILWRRVVVDRVTGAASGGSSPGRRHWPRCLTLWSAAAQHDAATGWMHRRRRRCAARALADFPWASRSTRCPHAAAPARAHGAPRHPAPACDDLDNNIATVNTGSAPPGVCDGSTAARRSGTTSARRGRHARPAPVPAARRRPARRRHPRAGDAVESGETQYIAPRTGCASSTPAATGGASRARTRRCSGP